MNYKVLLSKDATKYDWKLDPIQRKQIDKTLSKLQADPYSLANVKRMKGRLR
jgi:mRNA-degrading endonuclease RelE of RelBE toxin-antitoxin system